MGAHKRVDKNLPGLVLCDELGGAQLELFGVAGAGEVVAEVRVGDDARVSSLHPRQDVVRVDVGRNELVLQLRHAQLRHWLRLLLPPLRVKGDDGSVMEAA